MSSTRHQLAVDEIVETKRARTFEVSEAWWNARRLSDVEAPYAWTRLPRFELRHHRIGEALHLEGELEAELSLECSRCASRYRHALRESCRLVLSPAGERPVGELAEPESANALARDGLCLGDELERGAYRGTEIALDGWFSELISLALPVQPLCDEDCRGLCPHCGLDRNRGRCDCEEEERRRRSPFAVLADWKPAAAEAEGAPDPERTGDRGRSD